MKKGLLITLIFCVVLFLAGAAFLIVGLATGGKIFFTVDYKNRKVNTSSNLELITGEQELNEFDSIDIDISAAEVTVVEGDGYKVKYALYGNVEPTISVDDKKLSMKTEIESGTFSLDLFGNDPEKENPYVEITVPAGKKFETVNICTNAGDINLDGYEITTLMVQSNAGNSDLKNLSVGSIDLDLNYGKVKIVDTEATDVSVKASAGNAEISGLIADSATFDMNCGELDVLTSELGRLEAKQNLGKVKVDETKIDNIDIEADAGDVSLGLIGEKADYYFDIDSSAGDITVDGEKKENDYNANSGKDKTIKIETNAGSVSIDF